MNPSSWDSAPWDIAIVGAGVAGCTLAYALARRGRCALVLEAGSLGAQGASSVPLALLNPNRGRSARASPFDQAALAATWALVGELERLGLEPGAHRSGVLRVADSARQAKAWARLPGVRPFGAEGAPTGVHAPFGGVLVEGGGFVEPATLLAALMQAATARGARFKEGWRLEGLERCGDAWRLLGPRGSVCARAVVLATGAAQHPTLPLPPFQKSAGDLVGFAPAPLLALPVAGAVYAGRLADTLYVGGNHRPADAPDPEAGARLYRAARWLVPGLEQAVPRSHWTGVRASQEGNLPVGVALAPGVWFVGCFAGRGFLSAPYLAAAVAEELLAAGF